MYDVDGLFYIIKKATLLFRFADYTTHDTDIRLDHSRVRPRVQLSGVIGPESEGENGAIDLINNLVPKQPKRRVCQAVGPPIAVLC